MPNKKVYPSKRPEHNKTPEAEGPSSGAPSWQAAGESDKPLFFHKTDQPHGHFCQWYLSPIAAPAHTVNTIPVPALTFNCAEQYMMYHKAALFSDATTAAAILATNSPREQKLLGKKVRGFDSTVWNQHKFDVVVQANMLKYGAGSVNDSDAVYGEGGRNRREVVKLRDVILATGDRVLAEASKLDKVWGIGYNPREAAEGGKGRGIPQTRWGQNLLGRALLEVRRRLREEEEAGERQEEHDGQVEG